MLRAMRPRVRRAGPAPSKAGRSSTERSGPRTGAPAAWPTAGPGSQVRRGRPESRGRSAQEPATQEPGERRPASSGAPRASGRAAPEFPVHARGFGRRRPAFLRARDHGPAARRRADPNGAIPRQGGRARAACRATGLGPPVRAPAIQILTPQGLRCRRPGTGSPRRPRRDGRDPAGPRPSLPLRLRRGAPVLRVAAPAHAAADRRLARLPCRPRRETSLPGPPRCGRAKRSPARAPAGRGQAPAASFRSGASL